MLIRESPATELAVATRILARAGVLAPEGRVALLVGTDVVYLASRASSAATMTPYDVAAVRLDGTLLAGEPPVDAASYLEVIRAAPGTRAVARRAGGEVLAASTLRRCVEALLGRPYEQLEAEARLTGALFGAYPAGDGGTGS